MIKGVEAPTFQKQIRDSISVNNSQFGKRQRRMAFQMPGADNNNGYLSFSSDEEEFKKEKNLFGCGRKKRRVA